MVTVSFFYLEIKDADWTAVEITIESNGRRVAMYRNFDRAGIEPEDLWGNQTEKFRMPSVSAAMEMIESCAGYQRVADDEVPEAE